MSKESNTETNKRQKLDSDDPRYPVISDEEFKRALPLISGLETKSLRNNPEHTTEDDKGYYTYIDDRIIYVREKVNKKEKYYLIKCPNCDDFMQVLPKQINCKIFRHGAYMDTGKQLPPHHPKAECDRLFAEGLIYGCGKPFTFNGKNIRKCGYI